MSPILGIYASQISGHLWAPSGAYDSIVTANGTGASGTISFTSIPSTYTHLQIRGIMRNTTAAYNGSQGLGIRFNSDSAANYGVHWLTTQPDNAPTSPPVSANTLSLTMLNHNYTNPSDGVLANSYGVLICDLLDYANTNKYKTSRSLSGMDANGTGTNTGLNFISGLWRSTSAITQIDIISGAGNWTSNTSFALYGIKGN